MGSGKRDSGGSAVTQPADNLLVRVETAFNVLSTPFRMLQGWSEGPPTAKEYSGRGMLDVPEQGIIALLWVTGVINEPNISYEFQARCPGAAEHSASQRDGLLYVLRNVIQQVYSPKAEMAMIEDEFGKHPSVLVEGVIVPSWGATVNGIAPLAERLNLVYEIALAYRNDNDSL